MKQKNFLFAAILITMLASRESALANDKCLECHRTTEDKPSALYLHDIHYAKGITCAGCHGGNPNAEEMEQAMDKKEGFIGVPKGDDISKACAACHASSEKMKSFGSSLPTNQWEFLQTSVHAKPLLKGKEHIAQCITCHNAHGIVLVKNPASPVYPLNVVKTCSRCHADIVLMRSYNPSLPVDQLEKYRTSVHGIRNAKGDAKVAECAGCHGSHDIRSAKDVKSKVYVSNIPGTCAVCHSNATYMKEYAIPTDQYEKYSKSVHGVALLQKYDQSAPACNSCHGNHGAAPPGVESISKVCGSCHALNAELFSASPHKKAFDERKLPECETCHGNHEIITATNELLGVEPEAICSRCHTERQNVKGYQVAKTMRRLIDSMESDEQRARRLVNEAEQKGMEISEAKFRLRDVRQSRLQSRTVVHAFSEEKLTEVINNGLKTSSFIEAVSENAIREYYFRRIGLLIATLIITFVAVLLFLYVRRLEKKQTG
jgi:predicted CXXCH cytochrome family protein